MASSEIIHPWLFLGSVIDAAHWEGEALCVHELLFPPLIKPTEIRVPVVYQLIHPSRMVAQHQQLDVCKAIIAAHEESKVPLLVHCMAGVERSPLTIVWYLMSKGMTIDDAYKLVKSKRPQVEDRRQWLDPVVEGTVEPVEVQSP